MDKDIVFNNLKKGFGLAKKPLEEGKKVILFMRHSIRPIIHLPSLEVDLTDEGREFALECGTIFANENVTKLAASSSKRCITTAEQFKKSINLDNEIEVSKLLAGYWVEDTEKWTKAWEESNNNIKQLIDEMVFSQVPGAYSAKESINLLLNYFFKSNENVPGLEIHVSHDGCIMLLLAYLFNKNVNDINWVDMNDGVYLWFEENGLHVVYQRVEYTFNIDLEYA